eukprot:5540428-Pyramimonas_sp.AAC.1
MPAPAPHSPSSSDSQPTAAPPPAFSLQPPKVYEQTLSTRRTFDTLARACTCASNAWAFYEGMVEEDEEAQRGGATILKRRYSVAFG